MPKVLTALILAIVAAGMGPSELDPKILTKIEHEFSQPICPMSGPEGMRAQLDALRIPDPLPYLVEMAYKKYPPKLSGLNSTAVALIGVRPDPRAQETLRRLYGDRSLSLSGRLKAAEWLASRFHDETGLPLMARRLQSEEVQVRADTLANMSHVVSAKNVDLVLPLAKDKDVHVLERFGLLLSADSEFRRTVAPHLTREVQTWQGEQAARVGFVLMLIGDTSGTPAVREYLLGYRMPNDADSLRQLGYWCRSLARGGHLLGLDGAVHLFELYLGSGQDGYLGFVINTFADATEFPHRATQSAADNGRTAREAIEWWKTNRDLVHFEPASGKFIRRSAAALPPSLRIGKPFSVSISRPTASREETRALEAAEAWYPPRQEVLKAAGKAPFKLDAVPSDPALWWSSDFDGVHIAYAVTGDAVRYYLNLAEGFRRGRIEDGRVVRMQGSSLSYSASVSKMDRYAAGGRELADVYVVKMFLSWSAYCGPLCAMGFDKSREVVVSNDGTVLAVSGDGTPGVEVSRARGAHEMDHAG